MIFLIKKFIWPFKGINMSEEILWGENDLISKYLGEYEGHILQGILFKSKII